MPDKTKRIGQLIVQELNGSLDDSERQELNEWLALSTDNRSWYEQVKSGKFYLPRRLKEYEEAEMIREEGWNKLRAVKQSKVYSIGRRVAVSVAAIFLLIAAWITFWQYRDTQSVKPATIAVSNPGNDLLPGGNKAILTLADGSHIVLDSAANGRLAEQGGTRITKTDDGKLAYCVSNAKPNVLLYNTMTTPRGGQYKLKLPDGTDVWLNAASSITYPTAFTGNERLVKLTGEAYFEVAKNKAIPFKVVVNDIEVKVLGTHFNIMAYSDESSLKTTLLEGSIEMHKGTQVILLKPGQQAVVTSKLQVIKNANTEEAIAWKNEIFEFNNTDIQTVMRAVSRWYNVDVKFEGGSSDQKLTAVMNRNSKFDKIYQIISANGYHLKLQDNAIIVNP